MKDFFRLIRAIAFYIAFAFLLWCSYGLHDHGAKILLVFIINTKFFLSLFLLKDEVAKAQRKKGKTYISPFMPYLDFGFVAIMVYFNSPVIGIIHAISSAIWISIYSSEEKKND